MTKDIKKTIDLFSSCGDICRDLGGRLKQDIAFEFDREYIVFKTRSHRLAVHRSFIQEIKNNPRWIFRQFKREYEAQKERKELEEHGFEPVSKEDKDDRLNDAILLG